jgi:Domain of unknown function (DUF1844)
MADAQHTPEQQDEHDTTLSFVAFVLSLAHTTAVHLGDVPDPASGHPSPPNLPAAAQMIDILSLLEQKTRGNLTAEERQLLEQVLYELRLRFVEVRSAGGGAAHQAAEPQTETTTVPPSGSRTPSGIIIP